MSIIQKFDLVKLNSENQKSIKVPLSWGDEPEIFTTTVDTDSGWPLGTDEMF
jgi:hypothetical protein